MKGVAPHDLWDFPGVSEVREVGYGIHEVTIKLRREVLLEVGDAEKAIDLVFWAGEYEVAGIYCELKSGGRCEEVAWVTEYDDQGEIIDQELRAFPASDEDVAQILEGKRNPRRSRVRNLASRLARGESR